MAISRRRCRSSIPSRMKHNRIKFQELQIIYKMHQELHQLSKIIHLKLQEITPRRKIKLCIRSILTVTKSPHAKTMNTMITIATITTPKMLMQSTSTQMIFNMKCHSKVIVKSCIKMNFSYRRELKRKFPKILTIILMETNQII